MSAHRPHRQQRGVMLIEALIAILIFTIGILGVIGLQAAAVQQSTDAKNRAEAAYLADQLMGRMWSDNRTVANLQANYDMNTCGTTCAGMTSWFTTLQSTLPGVVATGDTNPQVQVDASGVVTIQIYWRAPNEPPTSPPHHFDIQAQIGQ
jgi:type IV pilus assembly protein PilV